MSMARDAFIQCFLFTKLDLVLKKEDLVSVLVSQL